MIVSTCTNVKLKESSKMYSRKNLVLVSNLLAAYLLNGDNNTFIEKFIASKANLY